MWYDYAQGDKRGLEVCNGDLRVVCGIDKASSWAIATFATDTEGVSVQLEFKATDPGASETYRWESVGRARGRVGPPQAEMRDLIQTTNGSSLRNQCLFVRTFNFDLSGKVWDELGIPPLLSSDFRDHPSDQSSPTCHSWTGSSVQSNPAPQYNGGPNFTDLNQAIKHPSMLLNRRLLEKYPNAEIVITEDADWMSVITDTDVTFPGPEVICSRVLASRETSEEEGVVTLSAKEDDIGDKNSAPFGPVDTRDILASSNDNECQSLSHSQGSVSVAFTHQESGLPQATSAENLEDITRPSLPDAAVVKSRPDSSKFSKESNEQIPGAVDLDVEKNEHRQPTSPSLLRLSHGGDGRYAPKILKEESYGSSTLYSDEGSEWDSISRASSFHPGGSFQSIADSDTFVSRAPSRLGHPKLAHYSDDRSQRISSAIDSYPKEYDEIVEHVGPYIYNRSSSLHIGPQDRTIVEGDHSLYFPNVDNPAMREEPFSMKSRGSFSMDSGGSFNMNIHGKKSGLQILEENIVRGARHDSFEWDGASRCHPETRKTILQEIWEWTDDHNLESRILWLHGPPGAGKTAIVGTLCERLKAAGRLGGDYFFSRNARTDVKPLFTTISHYLATTFPSVCKAIETLFADDPDVLHHTPDIQLRRLVIEPLLAFDNPNVSPLVIVIDGLDECEGRATQYRIIEQVFSVYRCNDAIPNVRFVIASRPEPWIHNKFTSERGELLHQVSLEQTAETSRDIRTYLQSGFQGICDDPNHQNRLSNITLPWPSPSDLDQLVEKASGQFIYASTVLKFINYPHAMLDERLKLVISLKSESPKPFAELDRLYTQILSMIPFPDQEKAISILGAVLYVSASTDTYQNETLSITELLLGLKAGESYSALHSVHSLLHIPQSFPSAAHRDAMTPKGYKEWLKDGSHAVRFYHKSFPDFLEDRTRSGEFFIDKNAVNTKLAVGCTNILKGLSAEYACSRLYCIAWNYATMRISDHCGAGGQPTPELQEALRQFDVFACFTPMFLSVHGDRIRPEALENIKKKVARQRSLAELYSRLKSETNNPPLEKDITRAMKLLIDHNLMFSSNFLLNQLQVLNNWFKHSKCPSHLYKELDIILNEIRSTRWKRKSSTV